MIPAFLLIGDLGGTLSRLSPHFFEWLSHFIDVLELFGWTGAAVTGIWLIYSRAMAYRRRDNTHEISITVNVLEPHESGNAENPVYVVKPRTLKDHAVKEVVGNDDKSATIVIKAARSLSPHDSVIKLSSHHKIRLMSKVVGEVTAIRGSTVLAQAARNSLDETEFLAAIVCEKPRDAEDDMDAKISVQLMRIEDVVMLDNPKVRLIEERDTQKHRRRLKTVYEMSQLYESWQRKDQGYERYMMTIIRLPN